MTPSFNIERLLARPKSGMSLSATGPAKPCTVHALAGHRPQLAGCSTAESKITCSSIAMPSTRRKRSTPR